MTTDENKRISARFFQEQDRLRGGPADDLCAPGYTAQIGSGPSMDLAGHKQFAQLFYAAFPDLYHTIEETLAEGDRVAVCFTLRGTHTGDLMGIPATGKPVTVGAIVLMQIVDGKVTELHGQFDQMGLMQQIGVIPSPGEAVA